jgi:hypothetical protein
MLMSHTIIWTEIVPFLEEILQYEHLPGWGRVYKRLTRRGEYWQQQQRNSGTKKKDTRGGKIYEKANHCIGVGNGNAFWCLICLCTRAG